MRKQSPRRGPEGAWKPGREVRGQGTPGTLRALPRNAPSFSFETLAGGGAAPRLHPRQTCAPGAGPTSCSLIYGGPWGQTGLGRLAERTPAPRMPGRARRTKAAWSPQKCHCQRRASGRPLTGTLACARTLPGPGTLVPKARRGPGLQAGPSLLQGSATPTAPRHPEEARDQDRPSQSEPLPHVVVPDSSATTNAGHLGPRC